MRSDEENKYIVVRAGSLRSRGNERLVQEEKILHNVEEEEGHGIGIRTVQKRFPSARHPTAKWSRLRPFASTDEPIFRIFFD